MKSLLSMLKQVHGLVGTQDLNSWEHSFVTSLWEQTADGTYTADLSEKQIETLLRIFNKHFA